jgi:hypothetical protein
VDWRERVKIFVGYTSAIPILWLYAVYSNTFFSRNITILYVNDGFIKILNAGIIVLTL